MSNDIVTRVREEGFITHMGGLSRESKLLHEAADEIERLRKELDTRIAMCDMRSEKIIELIEERDEARREVCSMNETGLRMNESDKRREAKRRGWDCFEENTHD